MLLMHAFMNKYLCLNYIQEHVIKNYDVTLTEFPIKKLPMNVLN
jgi:hypothetical protein